LSQQLDRGRHVCVFTLHPVRDVRILDRQIMSLARHGYCVTLFGRGDEPPFDLPGVHVHPVFPSMRRLPRRLAAIVQLTWHALRTKADIYHFHDPDLLPSGVLVRWLRRRPVIYDAHELYRVKFKLKALGRPRLQRLITWAFGLVEDVLVRLIGNVSAVYEEYATHFARLGCRTVITPNYASRAIYRSDEPTDAEWAARQNKLVYVGAVNPLRGALVIIDAMRLVRKERPGAELIMTGRFYKERHERLVRERLSRPGYEGCVRIVPEVPGPALPALLRQAMIGVSPLQDVGQYRIAVPSKFFDYMAEGLAIIASDLPPSRKYVQEVGCGLLVPPADVEAWAAAILELLRDPARAREMGRRGRKAFLERFNWEACEGEFLGLYDSL